MKPIIFFLILIFPFSQLFSQVGISTSPIIPNISSMLDIVSTSKGILIPRMTSAERNLIGSPATSLLIYNTTIGSYEYYNGTTWMAIAAGKLKELSDADGDTKINVEPTADADIIQFTANGVPIAYFNSKSLQMSGPGSSLYIGEDAGNSSTTGTYNTILGMFSGGS